MANGLFSIFSWSPSIKHYVNPIYYRKNTCSDSLRQLLEQCETLSVSDAAARAAALTSRRFSSRRLRRSMVSAVNLANSLRSIAAGSKLKVESRVRISVMVKILFVTIILKFIPRWFCNMQKDLVLCEYRRVDLFCWFQGIYFDFHR